MLSEQLNEVTQKVISLHAEKATTAADLEMEHKNSQSLSRKLSIAETDVKVTIDLRTWNKIMGCLYEYPLRES